MRIKWVFQNEGEMYVWGGGGGGGEGEKLSIVLLLWVEKVITNYAIGGKHFEKRKFYIFCLFNNAVM